MSDAAHLVRRFAESLRPGDPPADDDAWATHYLLPGEVALWRLMKGFDRRHAVGVAQRAMADLGADATRPVMAAALLHDVGKIDSRFGVWRRVGATLWSKARGVANVADGRSRTARYVNHPAIGAHLLRDAGSDPLTVAWAAEHHLAPSEWTIDRRVADGLKNADDD